MDSVWSRVFRGLALAFDGLAELSEGRPTAIEGTADPQEGVQPSTAAAELKGVLAGLAQQLAGGVGRTPEAAPPPVVADMPDFSEVPLHSTVVEHAEPDDSTVPDAENGIPILPCPEVDRQNKEARRRGKLRSDPVQSLSVASYWLAHLAEQPWRAEEWTRCIEALPGSAGARFNRAMDLGMSELQLYATYFDECIAALQAGKDKAQQMRDNIEKIGEDARTPDDLLDIDRVGRILFWLGDRPDVEALTSAPEPTGDVRDLGPDHITGPRGSTLQPSTHTEELLTVEELEERYPLPQDDTQEIEVGADARRDAFGSTHD